MSQMENIVEHEQIEPLLPWFVNGRLAEAERQRIDAHLRVCETCRDELAAQRRIHAVMSVDAGVERMPTAGLARLRRRIENLDEAGPGPAAADGAPSDEAARSGAPAGSSWRQRHGAIAASVAMAAVGALAALLWSQHERRLAPASYYTVTTTAPQPADTAIRAVFAPTVTLSELQQVLDDAHLKIISGPTEAGVYSLAIAGSPSVDWSLQRLRGHAVVRFAEPVIPASVAERER
ncbi:MAG TPA: zf-HC2 domain-containing protein [Steroidobacteraceae bacterium]|nr:zf-HC2 domain-containing protein [Steroidobacteraceae bacterium]